MPHDFIHIKQPGFNIKSESISLDHIISRHHRYDVKETHDNRGKGLYAAELIPKGALVWKLVPGINAFLHKGADK